MSAAEGMPARVAEADGAPRLLHPPATMEGLRRLARSGGIALRVRGACMEPSLRDGETVLVCARRLYLPGDLLAVGTAAGIVVHRFLGYSLLPRGWQVWTQADEAERSDAAVRLDDVVGRVEQRSGEAVRVALADRSRAMMRFLVAVGHGLRRRIHRAAGSPR